MTTLRGFHLFFICASIVLAAGFGMWCLFNQHIPIGLLSLALAVALVGYMGYFAKKAEELHLR